MVQYFVFNLLIRLFTQKRIQLLVQKELQHLSSRKECQGTYVPFTYKVQILNPSVLVNHEGKTISPLHEIAQTLSLIKFPP